MKNLLTLTDLTRKEVNNILEVATQMRKIAQTSYKKGPQLIGKVVGGVWNKPCTSSTAFQLATAYLSGTTCPVFGSDDELSQCRAFDNMGVNTLIVACDNDNLVNTIATTARANVINGGSSQYDPIGVLADLMALNSKLDGLSNLNVLAVGNRDVNKINELNYILQLFGSNLIWFLPPDDFVTARKGIVIDRAETAFSGVDAVIDLGLANFSDPEKYYGASGGISYKLMDMARINCPLLGSRHIVGNLGINEYPYSVVNTRESGYVAVAMAVLYLLQRD